MMGKNKGFTAILITGAGLFLVPFVAIQFTKKVNLELNDFLLQQVCCSARVYCVCLY